MAVYPNEIWPADGVVEALDGTLDVATGLPYIAKGTGPTSSPSYEVQYNRRQRRQNVILASWRQGMVVDEGGLKIGVYPLEYTLGGVRRTFTGVTGVSVPDDDTRMVYLDSAAALQVAADWPVDVSSYLPIAQVTALAGVVTIEDVRCRAAFHVPSVEMTTAPDRQVVTAHCASVGSGASALKVYEYRVPEDLILEDVQVFCTAMVATASVDVHEAGVSVLSAAATPVAGSLVRPGITDSAIALNASLTVHVTTGGSGSITNLSVAMVMRK